MQISKEKYIYLLFFGFLASLFILFAYNGYPLFGGDSYSFLPTAIHLDRGEGLINQLYKPTGSEQMLFYPPLFPYFQSLFLFTNNPNELFISLSITSILSLLFMMLALAKLFSNIEPSIFKYFLFFIVSIGITTGLDTSSGRPEILVNLLLSIGLYLYVNNFKYNDYYYGVLLTLIGITSVVTGIYVFLILVMLYFYKEKKLTNYLKLLSTCLIVFIIFLFFYPYSFADLIKTMLSEAQKIVFSRDDVYSFKEFVSYHLLYPSYTFYFIFFLLSIIFILSKIYKSIFTSVVFVLLLSLIYYFGFRNLATNYYVYCIYLVSAFIVLNVFLKSKFYIMLMLVFGLASIGFIRKSALFLYYYDEQAVVNTVNNSLENYNIVNYAKNSSFWVFHYYNNNEFDGKNNYYLYQQVFSSNIDIRKQDSVVVDFTNHSKFKFAGLTIANNPPFYYYKLVIEK